MVDYVTKQEMIDIFALNWPGTALPEPRTYMMGFHPAPSMSVEEFRRLLPETAVLPVTRYLLPNLWALNFVVDGLLGEGVAAQARFDPQAKAVGEWLRARHLDLPETLLPSAFLTRERP
jgi:hypothetical protein